jgi:hypothetical protein
MFLPIIALGFLIVAQNSTPPPAQATDHSAASAKADTPEKNASTLNSKLLNVTRIYIDDFGSETTAKQIQAMVINSLSESKRFIITENRERADAVLKGTALEKSSQEFHSLSDKAAAAVSRGGHSGEVNGSFSNGTGSVSGSSRGYSTGSAVAADDSTASTETINDARVAVRLVAADGDVVWTCTQESKGAKYKGASADVADKVVKQLLRDLDKLQIVSAAAKKSN